MEDDWVVHELAGHRKYEEVILWDEELGDSFPAEIRCLDPECGVVRYLSKPEAVNKIVTGTKQFFDRPFLEPYNG